MGLGGLTRDSIVGLNNLVNNDDDENHLPQRRPPSSHGSGASSEYSNLNGPWSVPRVSTQQTHSDDFFFIANDDLDSGLPSSVPTSVSLNDEHKNAEFEAASASLSPRSSAAVAAATSYNKVSATNSRSLDSYNTSPQASTYHGFQYEGYTDYYTEDYGSYMHNDFATGNATGEDGHIFCCLFAPWIKQSKAQLEDDEEVSSGHLSPDGSASWKSGEERECDADKSDLKPPKTTQQDASSDLDEISTPPAPALKNKNGEGESSEQKAVVFSMSDGLGPEKELSPHMMSSRRSDADDMTASSTASSTSCSEDQKFAAKEEAAGPEVTKPDTLKGILKVRCRPAQSSKNQKSSGKSSKASTPESPMKRHLFPSYNPRHTQFENSDSKKDLTFNPMARVLTIPSRIDIPYAQKTQVWWQRCDYDEFKKTGRIISKAMECGGSDIWLASSNAWGMKQANQRKAPRRMSSETEYDKALSQYVGEHESDSDDDGRLDYGNKWWCKFGHSRRGLEHVVSPSEGKARQKSVQLALQKVVDEQRRQRAARTKDPNKLRNVSMQYTSWARDLAHAAGIADAEAVSSHFDQSAKTRAHYYAKKMNISQGSSIDQNGVGSGVVRAVTSSILDANTHSKKKAESTSTPVPVRRSEISLGKRAKGFMPG